MELTVNEKLDLILKELKDTKTELNILKKKFNNFTKDSWEVLEQHTDIWNNFYYKVRYHNGVVKSMYGSQVDRSCVKEFQILKFPENK